MTTKLALYTRYVTLSSTLLAASFILSALPAPLTAQTASSLTPAAKFVDSARIEIDAASAASDDARLERTIVLLDRALTAFPKDVYLLHYRGYAKYRRVVAAFRSNKMSGIDPVIASGLSDLEQSSDKLKWAETYSLMSSMLAFRIAMDPSLGRELGAEIGELSGKAAGIGPNNPRVLLIQAYGAQNTPPEYGGGVDRARALAQRAVAAFATDKPGPLAPSWGKEEAEFLLKGLSGLLQ